MKLFNNSNKGIILQSIRFHLAVLFLVGISLSLLSCKKDKGEDEPKITETDKGTLLLHLHNYIGTTDIGEFPGLSNSDDNGREITINKANLYISEIQIVKLDGSVHNFSGKIILKTFENVLYTIGDVPVGNYNTVKFKIGLDPATNALDPQTSSDSVILNRNDMWYGSTPQPDGYVFMNIQGSIDTSSSLIGEFAPFNYKIGTNSNYIQVSVTGLNISVVKEQATVAHMVADYIELFAGIQINDVSNLSVATPADNNSTLAAALVNNIARIFKPE